MWGCGFPLAQSHPEASSFGRGNRKKGFLGGEAYEQWAATLYQGTEYFKSGKENRTMLLEGREGSGLPAGRGWRWGLRAGNGPLLHLGAAGCTGLLPM